jgi:lipid II:glycine glycyltransferase (peptidoglycan interpeptide bridge formation enzyme)
MTKVNLQAWQNFLEDQEAVHILQTGSWGILKADFGWSAHYFVQEQSGVQLLLKKLPFGFHIAYIPMGPVGPLSKSLLTEIRAFCRKNRTIFLKIEPDVWQEDFPASDVSAQFASMKPSKPIQPQRTILVDLHGSEADWLARMKQKTRYNIRLAEKKGVEVKTSESVEDFYALMIETGQRDGFGVHTKAYYQRAFDLFHPEDKCKLFLATFEDKPLAGVIIFISGKRSWYFYGASNDQERNLMPTYLLQWEAMRYCAAHGCTSYDLWGIPDADEETLESSFMDRKDGLWSVYRFKRGFGGQIHRTAGAWDDVYINPLYLIYEWWVNRHA